MAKRESDNESIKSVVSRFIKSNGFSQKFNEYQAVEAFSKLMGKLVMKKIKNAYMYNNTLFLEFSSASLRNELSMEKTKLMKLLNEQMGSKIITDMVFK